jgi:hypothetical protein
MKRFAITIAFITIMGMTCAQSPAVKGMMVGVKVVQSASSAQSNLCDIQEKAQSQALDRAGVSTYRPQPLTTSMPQPSASLELAKRASSVPTVGTLTLPTVKAMEDQEISYKKEKTTERRGSGFITMYNLMVTNYSNKDLYVSGSVHIIGEVEQEGRHFAGSVPAHSTKCLLTTIDEDFNGVRINWQDDM